MGVYVSKIPSSHGTSDIYHLGCTHLIGEKTNYPLVHFFYRVATTNRSWVYYVIQTFSPLACTEHLIVGLFSMSDGQPHAEVVSKSLSYTDEFEARNYEGRSKEVLFRYSWVVYLL